MRHKMTSIFALSLVLALAAGVALLAQETTTATGKVTNVDTSAGTVTVTTAGGSSQTFSTDAQSLYMSNGRTITLKTVKMGDQVTVTYRNDNGVNMATHVDVVSSGTPTATSDAYTNAPTPPATNPDMGNTNRDETYRNTADPNRMDATTTPTDDHLPRTASALPLIGLAAVLFGGAALTLVGFRRFAA